MTDTVTIDPTYWADLNALGRRTARFHLERGGPPSRRRGTNGNGK